MQLKRNLKLGLEGNDVLAVSKIMVDKGLLKDPTSQYNKTIEICTRILQIKNKLSVDGIFGPNSLKALQNETCNILSTPVPDLMNPVHTGIDQDLLMYNALLEGLNFIKLGAMEIGGNNKGKWVALFHKVEEERLLTGSWPWCAAFTDTCYELAAKKIKVDKGFNRSGLALNIRNQVKARNPNGKQLLKANTYRPGMLAFWTRGDTTWQGHIEMVHSVFDDYVIFLGGNRTNKVDLFVQPLNKLDFGDCKFSTVSLVRPRV